MSDRPSSSRPALRPDQAPAVDPASGLTVSQAHRDAARLRTEVREVSAAEKSAQRQQAERPAKSTLR